MASNTSSWERAVGRSLLKSSRRSRVLPTPWFQTAASVLFKPSACSALRGGPRTLVETGQYLEAAVSTGASPPS